MARQSHLDHLASVSLFSACSKKELQAVARASDELDLPAGKPSASRAASGARPSSSSRAPPRSGATARRSPRSAAGACFGELALLDHGPRTATVVAATDLKVLVIGAREFAAILDEVPPIAHKLLQVAGRVASASSTPRPTADAARVRAATSARNYVRRREVPRQAPPARHRASASCSPRSRLVSGITRHGRSSGTTTATCSARCSGTSRARGSSSSTRCSRC